MLLIKLICLASEGALRRCTSLRGWVCGTGFEACQGHSKLDSTTLSFPEVILPASSSASLAFLVGKEEFPTPP